MTVVHLHPASHTTDPGWEPERSSDKGILPCVTDPTLFDLHRDGESTHRNAPDPWREARWNKAATLCRGCRDRDACLERGITSKADGVHAGVLLVDGAVEKRLAS